MVWYTPTDLWIKSLYTQEGHTGVLPAEGYRQAAGSQVHYQVSLPVEGVQQVELCSVCHVDEFALNREEAAVCCTLRRRRRPRTVEETPWSYLTAARTCRSKVNKSMTLVQSGNHTNTNKTGLKESGGSFHWTNPNPYHLSVNLRNLYFMWVFPYYDTYDLWKS